MKHKISSLAKNSLPTGWLYFVQIYIKSLSSLYSMDDMDALLCNSKQEGMCRGAGLLNRAFKYSILIECQNHLPSEQCD
jgi:hypothetical protein